MMALAGGATEGAPALSPSQQEAQAESATGSSPEAPEDKAQHRILSKLTSDLSANLTELPAGSRRGTASLRQKHMDAYDSLSFPDYPSELAPSSDFDLPRSLLDADAPVSARKW